jgi:hypothetical protein
MGIACQSYKPISAFISNLKAEVRIIVSKVDHTTGPQSAPLPRYLIRTAGSQSRRNRSVTAESTGLRDNQVKYWLDAFNRNRPIILPKQGLKGMNLDNLAPNSDMLIEDALSAEYTSKIKKNKRSKIKSAKSSKEKNTKKCKKSKNKKELLK